MLLSTKLTHMVTPVKNSLLGLLTISTIFLTYLYGFLFSFMIVFHKQINIFLLNLIVPLFTSFFMKMEQITESLWTQKDLFLFRLKECLTFLL